MTQHAKLSEFEADAQTAQAKVAETAADAVASVQKSGEDLVAWASKAIDDNPGLAVAGAVAVGAAFAYLIVSRAQPERKIARLRQQAMDYGDRLERRARRELRKIDASRSVDGVSDFFSSYGSQLSGLMSGLATQAQQILEQARSAKR